MQLAWILELSLDGQCWSRPQPVEKVATSVYTYKNRVIDDFLPVDGAPVRLEPEWALQDPEDYIRTFQYTIPAVLKESRIDQGDVIGIGIDFTACTMMPVKKDATPLCMIPGLRRDPHAWVKLWKHHAAQPEADQINAIARQMGQCGWIVMVEKFHRNGSFPRPLQILHEAPEIYQAADRLLEAADWVVWQLRAWRHAIPARLVIKRCGRNGRGSRIKNTSLLWIQSWKM